MTNSASISVSRPNEGVAVLAFRGTSSNDVHLSGGTLDEFIRCLDQLEADEAIVGLAITTEGSGTRLLGPPKHPLRIMAADVERGRVLRRRLVQSRLMTLAVIQCPWRGAAVELAAWCDGRMMSENVAATCCLDDVLCGLTPMWGAVAVLPRLVGLDVAITWLTSGAMVTRQEAVEARFAEILPTDALPQGLADWLTRNAASDRLKDKRHELAQPLAAGATDLDAICQGSLEQIRKMPTEQRLAAAAIVDLVLKSSQLPIDEACELESQQWSSLHRQMPSRALVNVAALAEKIRGDVGVEPSSDQPRPVRKIGILGAGIMGEGIAAVNLQHALPVVMQDASGDALNRCLRALASTQAAFEKTCPQASAADADADLSDCDILIETIVENKDVKQRVLNRISPHLDSGAVVASNTSTIPISLLAESVPVPERFCGIHFCNPVERMPLVEVIRGKKTSDSTVRTVVHYAKQIGKLPIVVNDCPGFLINRLLLLYMNEALTLYCEGVPLEQIERVATVFGMEVGPFELFDVIGVDTAMYGGKLLWEAFPDRISLTPVLPAMVKRSWLGKKQGRGFYLYDDQGNRGEVDPELQGILESYVRPAGPRSDQQVLDRLLLSVLLEATRILEDGIVRDVRDVDSGLVFGLGFPRRCGGLLFWADGIGARQLLEMLEPLAKLGPRMQPTQLLTDMANKGSRFYELEGCHPCDA